MKAFKNLLRRKKIISTDSPELIKWRREQEAIRREKESHHEATISQLKQRLKAGEITQEEYDVGALQSYIEFF